FHKGYDLVISLGWRQTPNVPVDVVQVDLGIADHDRLRIGARHNMPLRMAAPEQSNDGLPEGILIERVRPRAGRDERESGTATQQAQDRSSRNHVLHLPAWSSRSASLNPAESVGAPVLAAHAVMEEEEAVWVVFLLNALKALVVVAPEGVLPFRLEVVRLPNVGGGARHGVAQF